MPNYFQSKADIGAKTEFVPKTLLMQIVYNHNLQSKTQRFFTRIKLRAIVANRVKPLKREQITTSFRVMRP